MKDFVVFDGEHPAGMGGQQMILRFPNDYGASIIRFAYSYGGSEGKFELAVIRWHGDNWSLCYDTPITDDVLGYLSPEEVLSTLSEIQALPACSELVWLFKYRK